MLLTVVNPCTAPHRVWNSWETVVTLTARHLVHRDMDTAKYRTLLCNASVGITPTRKSWINRISVFGCKSRQGLINLSEMLAEAVIVFYGIQRHIKRREERKEVTDPDAESGFEWTVLLGIPLLPLLGKKRWINPDALDLSRT